MNRTGPKVSGTDSIQYTMDENRHVSVPHWSPFVLLSDDRTLHRRRRCPRFQWASKFEQNFGARTDRMIAAFTCSPPLRFNWVLKSPCADLRGVRTRITQKKKTKNENKNKNLNHFHELWDRSQGRSIRTIRGTHSCCNESVVWFWESFVFLVVLCGHFEVIACLLVCLFVLSFKANGARLWCNGSGEDVRR